MGRRRNQKGQIPGDNVWNNKKQGTWSDIVPTNEAFVEYYKVSLLLTHMIKDAATEAEELLT